jgi:hypothetical protein
MRRFIPRGSKGQALIEYALGIVFVAFAATAGSLLFGPSIKTWIANDYESSWPEVRFAGLSVVVNPTDRPAFTPTSTSEYPPTSTTEPTATSEATATTEPTVTPTATLMPEPTFTSTPEPTLTVPTATSTPEMTYQEWCLSMGYTWRPWLQVCTIGWAVVTPPAP